MTDNYRIIFHPLAEIEYLDSVSWYEDNRTGLGIQFIREIEKKLNIIETNPYLYPIKKQMFREAVIDVFPYVIVYKIYKRKKSITIYSVFHTSRNPALKYRR
ncbi:MAG: hypothetical protein A3H98_07300 [Bacteroidetes bacterium RIFCSPLOWO2_02_FULL_36_8]|nr:MAG: hypothetical protein A3H98_07300 [Bacteroidetes bacterium RIFCSPLOWO2_02_FULL_36_8]OFY69262.1 MAG: hypothetical protein A3G23_02220 [Bacteroidetes bacterium RIFCSPLOWO2_12_FULL_37_12]